MRVDTPVIAGFTVLGDAPVPCHRAPLGQVHLVGVAGNGMRALADVLAGCGWDVSGSDRFCDGRLGATGLSSGARSIHYSQGHAAENVPAEAALVVYSDAVPMTNPELCRAVELGLPTLSYFEMLGRLSADHHTVAAAGTHGKSSTTAMLAHILVAAGRDPTVLCGATPLGATSGGRAGRDELMLIEACEYRRNFLHLRPQQAAVLGIEPDHFDCYESLQQIEDAFQRFAESVPADGMLLIRHDCPSTRRAAAGATCRVESFGLSEDADWSADRIADDRGMFRFGVRHFGRRFCDVRLRVPGRHSVLNALAAAALAWHNGVAAATIAAGLNSFPGLHRRMEVLGTWRGITHVDDYAHHPTEVTAALAAVRRMFPNCRVWCVFQPHQASRTARLLDEFGASLQNADKVMVAEIFRAREGNPQTGEVTAAHLAERARRLGADVLPFHSLEEIAAVLQTHLASGDVLVTLGAGDVARLRILAGIAGEMTREHLYEPIDRL